jgi:16S rRNA (adenine1518-N6/adenine1519-N6)-dimethyltransferase
MSASKIFDIPPKNFYPVPKVWSSLVLLKPKQKIAKIKYSKSLEHITNIFFNQRRKMIKKPIKQIFNNHENVLKKLNLDLTLRPQNLSIDKYFEICKIYEDLL